MKKKDKKPVSILIQSLQTEPRPHQPLFSCIIAISAVLDAIRIVLKSILLLIAIILFSGIVVGIICWVKFEPEYHTYMENAEKTVAETTPDTFRYNETTILYYADGTKMSELRKDSDTVYLKYEDIPDDIVKAFVAVEDRSFWTNPGIDLKGIVKAGYDAVVSKGKNVRGASTITQQLARCVFLNNGVTIDRKFMEMALAIKLTEYYSKEQIMEFYVNNIYYANGFYGIESAAQGYFSKSAAELTLSETAYICAIPNSPTFYDPYNDPARAVERRDHILDSMYEVGFISWEELESAKKEIIEVNGSDKMAGGYEVTYAADCAIRCFMELDGFSFQYHFDTDEEFSAYKEAYDEEYERMREELYRGGYRIYTSIDKSTQQMLQENVDIFLADTRTEEAEDLQAAVVLSDSKGQVISIIGGGSEAESFGLNRAYQSYRQPGSTVKPLILYGPALESGYTPDSLVKNISVSDAHQKEKDRIEKGISYDLKSLPGQEVTLRVGLEKSLNGVAYMLMDDLGVGTAVPYLEKMHFTKIMPEDYTMAAALGGLTYGASPVEMCSAYACISNSGRYNEPTCLTGITNRYGAQMYEKKKEVRIYSRESAGALTDMMEGVMVRGTGASLGWYKKSSDKAYVKTGTTNNQKDGWMCGWVDSDSGSSVLSVWVGCDMPKSLAGLWGSTYPGKLWMESALDATMGYAER